MLVIPCDDAPRCGCGAVKVAVYRDGLEQLMDNMGCELGLERVAGPLCPRCDASQLERWRSSRAQLEGGAAP
jgi:hypothetical protein